MAATLPNIPAAPNPVGIDINNAPIGDSAIASLNPKVINIGKVISPAVNPTKVSKEATLKLNLGRLLFLFRYEA